MKRGQQKYTGLFFLIKEPTNMIFKITLQWAIHTVRSKAKKI